MQVMFRTGKCGKTVGFRGGRSLRHHRKGERAREQTHRELVQGCKLTRIMLN